MSTNLVLRSEWLKIRTLRSTMGSLIAVFVVTVGISALVSGLSSGSAAASLGPDPLARSFYGLTFGQIAAISFGALAVSQEFHSGAMRVWLAAVPRRGVLYATKIVTVGGAMLVVGVVTGLVIVALGRALIGDSVTLDASAFRAAIGSGTYLALMALFAAGLTMLLRSGVAVLSLLIPVLLIVPFVFHDVASGLVDYLPDRAGQLVVQQDPTGPIGPWAALGVTALWAAAALLAGWFAFNRRDA